MKQQLNKKKTLIFFFHRTCSYVEVKSLQFGTKNHLQYIRKSTFFFIPPLYVLINQDLQNSADKENNVKKQSLKERDSEK